MLFQPLYFNRRRMIRCFTAVAFLSLLFGCQRPQAEKPIEKIGPKLTNESETYRGARVAPRQVLMKISRCDGVDSQKLTESIRTLAIEITHDEGTTARRATNGCWFLIKVPTQTVPQLLERFNSLIASNRSFGLDQLSFTVVDVEPNFVMTLEPPTGDRPPAASPSATPTASGTPDDPYYQTNLQWGLNNHDHPGMDVSAPAAWTRSTGTDTIVVGVLDTGIYYEHPDLRDNVWSAPRDYDVTVGGENVHCLAGTHGFNAVPLTEAEICDPLDQTYNSGHGTHVAGIIGAVGNNTQGVAGVNWRTKLVGIKVLNFFGGTDIPTVIRAIEFATQLKEKFPSEANIRVLNASFGFLGEGVPESDLTALREAIELARDRNMLFVASAGNDHGNDNDTKAHYPSGFYALSNVLSVTAIDDSGAIATGGGGFANHGKLSVHLGAPGSEIYSTYPLSLGDSYFVKSGTSMATPFVSGAAALILSVPACSSLNVADLRDLINNGVEPTDSLKDVTVKEGRLNISKSISLCPGGP